MKKILVTAVASAISLLTDCGEGGDATPPVAPFEPATITSSSWANAATLTIPAA